MPNLEKSKNISILYKNIKHIIDTSKQEALSHFLKDPCLLDFLELQDSFSERNLESAILKELEKFILEFGSDFAFLSRQQRIQIGNNDYVMFFIIENSKDWC